MRKLHKLWIDIQLMWWNIYQKIFHRCPICHNKIYKRQSDFTEPYWYCSNCNGN